MQLTENACITIPKLYFITYETNSFIPFICLCFTAVKAQKVFQKLLGSSNNLFNSSEYLSLKLNIKILNEAYKLEDPYFIHQGYRYLAYDYLFLNNTILVMDSFKKSENYKNILGKHYYYYYFWEKKYMKYFTVILVINALCSFTAINSQIVNIPDSEFKDLLVYGLCVDVDGDGVFESNVDANNDGEIQVTEAEAVLRLKVNLVSLNDISIEGIQSFVNLIEFDFRCMFVTNFDLSQQVNLERFICHNTNLSEFNFSQNLQLESLELASNHSLTSVDVSQLSNLTNLILYANNLTEIIFSNNNLNIELLYVDHNPSLTSLDLSQIANLRILLSQSCSLSELDLTQNTQLSQIDVSDNLLTYLNLKNENNTNIITMKAQGNPDLSCLQVDNVIYANSQTCNNQNIIWCKDETTTYSEEEDCDNLGVNQYLENQITFYPNPVKNILYIEYNNGLIVNNIQAYNVLGKKILDTNMTNQIDVSAFDNGLFFLKAETNMGGITAKIIKE